MQQKTQRSVQFEITEPTREAIATWINRASLRSEDHLFPSRLHGSQHLSTRQYARSLPLTNPKHAATARISRHGREGISYPSALPRSRHCAPMQKCSPQ
jgi:hypothetical protein